ncbi:hypothetical protein HPB52_011425 [Rhipicephalus sanguineus]|uniref:CCHC-type domain-containing protein n=1 Tax=Rhipicephalus sanguineus TaxID=34632 RepID=A0A9D4QDJ0_RHISA|nr:hypothetical protein HPB52_011425 [Rhipicephalus sanguineus]
MPRTSYPPLLCDALSSRVDLKHMAIDCNEFMPAAVHVFELERRSRIPLDEWLLDLAANDLTHPAPSSGTRNTKANPPTNSALAEPVNPAAQVTPRDCPSVVLRDNLLAEGIGVPLPASGDEVDMSSSRKRAREDSSDEDEQGPRKQLPTDYPAQLPDDHGDDDSHTSNLTTPAQLESSADIGDTSVTLSPSVGNALVAPAPATSQLLEADDIEANTAPHKSTCHPPLQTLQQHSCGIPRVSRQAVEQHTLSATPVASTYIAADPRTAPAAATTTIEERDVPSSNSHPVVDEGFRPVLSKGARRRAKASGSAALPVNPTVIGTVLFRLSVPGGAFRDSPRLSLAQELSSRPGIAAIPTREGSAVTLRFAGPVPPEHVSLFRVHFWVRRPARPRPLQCRQCGRFGHVVEPCKWPSGCIRCGRTHKEGAECTRVRCVNCGGGHPADTPAFTRWQEERRVATIMATSTTALSRRVVKAAIREEHLLEQVPRAPARSYSNVLQGNPPPAVRQLPPVPTPRTSRRHAPAAASTTQPPAAPSVQPSMDALLANLLVTMQAVAVMLPADNPLHAIFLQAAAVQSSNTNHG